MRLVFLGTGEFGVPALAALRAAGHEIVAAVSQPDRPAGRNRRVAATPIRARALELGLRHLQVEDVNAELPDDVLAAAEIGVVVAFGQKLGAGLLARVPRGFVNIHGSLLPKYRGAAPIQWAIIRGEAVTGVTTFQLDERWDNGPIWGRRETAIGATETADELHDRLAVLGAELIVETLGELAAGRAVPQTQTAGEATRAPKLRRGDGVVDWSQSAEAIVRRIHGLWSWPAATCLLITQSGRRERVQLARATIAEAGAGASDAVGGFTADLTVIAGNGGVRLLEVKPEGGRLMSFEDFARGRQIRAGDVLAPLEDSPAGGRRPA